MSAPSSGRPRWIALLDLAALGALAAAAGLLGARLAAAPPAAWWPLLALAIVAGVAAADLASGLVHWFCDTWFSPSTPWVGRLLIAPFREHHDDPLAITRRGVAEVSAYNALLGAVLLAGLAPWADAFGRTLLPSVALAFGSALALATVATNQIHRWAHLSRPPRLVAWLQRAGLLLSPAMHARHHEGAQDRAYCVTVGWCNPLLDRSGLLPRIEARVARARHRHGAAVRREA